MLLHTRNTCVMYVTTTTMYPVPQEGSSKIGEVDLFRGYGKIGKKINDLSFFSL